jgi:hypothetical protein
MSHSCNSKTLKFFVVSTAFIAATLTHAADRKIFDPYDAYAELSGTHATAKMKTSGLAGKPGEMGEPDRAGNKREVIERSTAFDINGDVVGGCSKYLRCSGY